MNCCSLQGGQWTPRQAVTTVLVRIPTASLVIDGAKAGDNNGSAEEDGILLMDHGCLLMSSPALNNNNNNSN